MSCFNRWVIAIAMALVGLYPLTSWALFDEILGAADKAAEIGALADATKELLKDVDSGSTSEPLDELGREADKFNQELLKLEKKARNLEWAKSEIKELRKGPDYSHQTLLESIKRTSDYLRRVKKLLASLAAFPKASSAYSQAETTIALQDQLKLQRANLVVQYQILNQLKITQAKKDFEDKAFEELMTQEFAKRRGFRP